jgi:hypothetical protein
MRPKSVNQPSHTFSDVRKLSAPTFSSRHPRSFFETPHGIINNKSELGIRVEKLLPELSSPFEMTGATAFKPGNSTQMKTQTMIQKLIPIFILILCVTLSPEAPAISPPPDGCYPNFATAEECKALQSLTNGVANTGIGWYSLFGTSSGSYNTAVGAGALDLNNADSNTAVGVAALLLNTTGTNNTATGTGALVFNDSGEGNTATGAFAMYNNTEDQFNTANGEFTLCFNTIGERNTAIGDSALYQNTEGNRNTAVGNPALRNNTTGNDNTAVGAAALSDNTTGGLNTAIGFGALGSNSTAIANTATGWQALLAIRLVNEILPTVVAHSRPTQKVISTRPWVNSP